MLESLLENAFITHTVAHTQLKSNNLIFSFDSTRLVHLDRASLSIVLYIERVSLCPSPDSCITTRVSHWCATCTYIYSVCVIILKFIPYRNCNDLTQFIRSFLWIATKNRFYLFGHFPCRLIKRQPPNGDLSEFCKPNYVFFVCIFIFHHGYTLKIIARKRSTFSLSCQWCSWPRSHQLSSCFAAFSQW